MSPTHSIGFLEIEKHKHYLYKDRIYLVGSMKLLDKNYIKLKDASVDLKHTLIYVTSSAISLVDLGSESGTYINGIRIKPLIKSIVKNCDKTRFGNAAGKIEISKTKYHHNKSIISNNNKSPNKIEISRTEKQNPYSPPCYDLKNAFHTNVSYVNLNKNRESFNIPETQQIDFNIDDIDDNDCDDDDDFCVPETQEVVTDVCPLDSSEADVNFQINTQDFFDENPEESGISQTSVLLPHPEYVIHEEVFLQHEHDYSNQDGIRPSPNRTDGRCTPDLLTLPHMDYPTAYHRTSSPIKSSQRNKSLQDTIVENTQNTPKHTQPTNIHSKEPQSEYYVGDIPPTQPNIAIEHTNELLDNQAKLPKKMVRIDPQVYSVLKCTQGPKYDINQIKKAALHQPRPQSQLPIKPNIITPPYEDDFYLPETQLFQQEQQSEHQSRLRHQHFLDIPPTQPAPYTKPLSIFVEEQLGRITTTTSSTSTADSFLKKDLAKTRELIHENKMIFDKMRETRELIHENDIIFEKMDEIPRKNNTESNSTDEKANSQNVATLMVEIDDKSSEKSVNNSNSMIEFPEANELMQTPPILKMHFTKDTNQLRKQNEKLQRRSLEYDISDDDDIDGINNIAKNSLRFSTGQTRAKDFAVLIKSNISIEKQMFHILSSKRQSRNNDFTNDEENKKVPLSIGSDYSEKQNSIEKYQNNKIFYRISSLSKQSSSEDENISRKNVVNNTLYELMGRKRLNSLDNEDDTKVSTIKQSNESEKLQQQEQHKEANNNDKRSLTISSLSNDTSSEDDGNAQEYKISKLMDTKRLKSTDDATDTKVNIKTQPITIEEKIIDKSETTKLNVNTNEFTIKKSTVRLRKMSSTINGEYLKNYELVSSNDLPKIQKPEQKNNQIKEMQILIKEEKVSTTKEDIVPLTKDIIVLSVKEMKLAIPSNKEMEAKTKLKEVGKVTTIRDDNKVSIKDIDGESRLKDIKVSQVKKKNASIVKDEKKVSTTNEIEGISKFKSKKVSTVKDENKISTTKEVDAASTVKNEKVTVKAKKISTVKDEKKGSTVKDEKKGSTVKKEKMPIVKDKKIDVVKNKKVSTVKKDENKSKVKYDGFFSSCASSIMVEEGNNFNPKTNNLLHKRTSNIETIIMVQHFMHGTPNLALKSTTDNKSIDVQDTDKKRKEKKEKLLVEKLVEPLRRTTRLQSVKQEVMALKGESGTTHMEMINQKIPQLKENNETVIPKESLKRTKRVKSGRQELPESEESNEALILKESLQNTIRVQSEHQDVLPEVKASKESIILNESMKCTTPMQSVHKEVLEFKEGNETVILNGSLKRTTRKQSVHQEVPALKETKKSIITNELFKCTIPVQSVHQEVPQLKESNETAITKESLKRTRCVQIVYQEVPELKEVKESTISKRTKRVQSVHQEVPELKANKETVISKAPLRQEILLQSVRTSDTVKTISDKPISDTNRLKSVYKEVRYRDELDISREKEKLSTPLQNISSVNDRKPLEEKLKRKVRLQSAQQDVIIHTALVSKEKPDRLQSLAEIKIKDNNNDMMMKNSRNPDKTKQSNAKVESTVVKKTNEMIVSKKYEQKVRIEDATAMKSVIENNTRKRRANTIDVESKKKRTDREDSLQNPKEKLPTTIRYENRKSIIEDIIKINNESKVKAQQKKGRIKFAEQEDLKPNLRSMKTNAGLGANGEMTKLKVAATMVDQKILTMIVHEAPATVGWKFTNDPTVADILIMDKGNRTYKFLIAVARGIPVVTSSWLIFFTKTGVLPKISKFFFHDSNFEKRHRFKLLTSLDMARKNKLFEGLTFLMTPSIEPDPEEMKNIITAAGGSLNVEDSEEFKESQTVFLVTSLLDKKLWPKYRRNNSHICIITTEAIMGAVMRQSLQPLTDHTIS